VVVLLIKPRRHCLLQMMIQTQHHQILKRIRRRIRLTKRLNQKRRRRMKKKLKRKKRRKRERKRSQLKRKVTVLREMSLRRNEVDIFKTTLFLGNINALFKTILYTNLKYFK